MTGDGYYSRDPMQRTVVTKCSAKPYRCDGNFQRRGSGRRCNALLLERVSITQGSVVVIKCSRCGKRHEMKG